MSGPPVYPFMKKVSGEIPRNGLVAEYLANNNTLDTSGNGYDGIGTDITFGNNRHGTPDSAFVLNGSSSFVNIDAALAGLSTTTKGTFSAWVKVNLLSPAQSILTAGDTNADERLLFQIANDISGNTQSFVSKNGATRFNMKSTDDAISPLVWQHLLLTQDGIEVKDYLDGNLQNNTFLNSTLKSAWFNILIGLDNMRIGNLNFDSGGEQFYFEGSIYNVRIYDRDLSQAEITILANE